VPDGLVRQLSPQVENLEIGESSKGLHSFVRLTFVILPSE
jgi:hypothetical protein